MAAAVCLRATEVDDTQYADIDDKFQDLFVDRRSLDMYQTSSLEGENWPYRSKYFIKNIALRSVLNHYFEQTFSKYMK